MTEREDLIRSIIEELAEQDLSGPGWNDYDENGTPYWQKDIPQYPPRAEWCKDEHTWHCENDDHFYDCFCTTCDYWKEWLLK